MNVNKLSENIDLLRTLLYSLLSKKSPTDKHVVNCSQELDKLIVEYQKILLNNSKRN